MRDLIEQIRETSIAMNKAVAEQVAPQTVPRVWGPTPVEINGHIRTAHFAMTLANGGYTLRNRIGALPEIVETLEIFVAPATNNDWQDSAKADEIAEKVDEFSSVIAGRGDYDNAAWLKLAAHALNDLQHSLNFERSQNVLMRNGIENTRKEIKAAQERIAALERERDGEDWGVGL